MEFPNLRYKGRGYKRKNELNYCPILQILDVYDNQASRCHRVSPGVQPVAELSELSRRGGSDGRQVELAAANIRGGTLRRSGSLRFHQNMNFGSDCFVSGFISFVCLLIGCEEYWGCAPASMSFSGGGGLNNLGPCAYLKGDILLLVTVYPSGGLGHNECIEVKGR
ncbi:hypothetical protein WN48_02137 [Eufriesea mexicana]|uniref:Uncharacterized protein n=1 Tax=Eufriesea mexicana TaxID=516756 RepID=A0A310SG37_9HYME|nr:hypothetical protein WN48_02137 [Eufriesea mexicana]